VDRDLFSRDFKVDLVHSDGSITKTSIDTESFFTGTVEGEKSELRNLIK
jgi:hypothetical protein